MTLQQVMVVHYDDSCWGVEFPHHPGVTGSRETSGEASRLAETLAQTLLDPEADTVEVSQIEFALDKDGNAYRLIIARDDFDERATIATTAKRMIERDEPLYVRPVTPIATGERQVLAVLPTDTVGWILSFIRKGESALVFNWSQNGVLQALEISNDQDIDGVGLNELGITEVSTFDEALRALMGHEVGRMSRPLLA